MAPLAFDYLQTALEDIGIETRIVDLCGHREPQLALATALEEPSITCVGITVRNTDNSSYPGTEYFLPQVQDIVATLKRLYPSIPVVLGGAAFSAMPSETLRFCRADYGVIGAGELAFRKLVLQLAEGDARPIPGVLRRDQVTVSSSRGTRTALGVTGFTIRRNLPFARAYYDAGGIAGVETKRGCSHSCVYCIDPIGNGSQPVLRNVQEVGSEIAQLVSSGLTRLHMCDSEFNVPEAHAIDVCQEIDRLGLGDKVTWYCYLTPAGVSRELVYWLKRAGCCGVIFCTEHCVDTILRTLQKGFTFGDVQAASRYCQELGVPFLHSILLGAPGENRLTTRDCITRLKSLDADVVKVSVGIRVYPHTHLAHLVRSNNWPALLPGGIVAPIGDRDLLEPTFFVSEDVIGDHDFDEYLAGCIASDARFLHYPFRSSSTEPHYHYDWMKLAAKTGLKPIAPYEQGSSSPPL